MAQRQSKEFWCEHLDGWRQSGQTQVTYCTSRGLNLKTFNRWLGKERRAEENFEPKLTLVPISIKAPTTRHAIQLHSPQGWRIELAGTVKPQLITTFAGVVAVGILLVSDPKRLMVIDVPTLGPTVRMRH